MWEMDFQAERTARSKSPKFPRGRCIFWEQTDNQLDGTGKTDKDDKG